MLNHPSLTELLPSGVFMVNDDYNNRMVAIDPATRALVWQYGITGRPGTAPGKLRETTWSGSGGGASADEPIPGYQSSYTGPLPPLTE